MHKDREQVPGAGVWIALAVATLTLVLFAYFLPSKQAREQSAMEQWLLAHDSARGERILALGSSLTGCGLDAALRLEEQIMRKTGISASVFKLWKLDAQPRDFASMAESLESVRPAVVVIEANMLLYTFARKQGWTAYVQRLRDAVLRHRFRYDAEERPTIVPRRISELEAFRTGLTDTSELRAFGQLLRFWSAHNVKVVVLNFPLEGQLEERKWHSADTAVFDRNIAYLRRFAGLQVVAPPERWCEQYFIDHAHLNTAGAQRQSEVFTTSVANALKHP